jgi:type I restriction enzyme M protein
MVQKNSLQVVDWYGTQEKATQLDVYGRIIDFLDPERTRDNKPEERVRQSLARNLHFDLAYPKRYMAMSAAVAIGTEKKEADLVVYSSSRACKERDQSKIAFIAETKAPDLKTGKKQLFSYIFATSAEGGLWTNGDETAHWRRQQSPQDLINWPGIPRFGWAWDSVGSYKKGELQKPHNLKFTFRKCHNALYRSGISSEDVAMDMVRILLAKQRDELNPGEECEFHCTPSELQTLKGQTAV